ncbi:unnamed protein product, partial [Heterosigma akashiwo]
MQCGDHCGDECENTKVYVAGLSANTREDDLKDLFGQLGMIKENKKRKADYKWMIRLYKPGQEDGDALIQYDDPNAAHSAPKFFNGNELKGKKLKVTMAEVKEYVDYR